METGESDGAMVGVQGTEVNSGTTVEPELKSPHSYQVPVDFENLGLLLRNGRQVFFPYSTPRCPYYDPKA